jgi:hypothetical protein
MESKTAPDFKLVAVLSTRLRTPHGYFSAPEEAILDWMELRDALGA